MRAFEIKTTKSDHPFMVIADGFMEAVGILERERNVWDGDIISVQQLDAYKSDHILVRDLMGLKVMLVYYPGHLATAVQFSRPLTGKYQDRLILENGDEYYICDPTNYVPEPGVTMEGMNNAQAKVVMLD